MKKKQKVMALLLVLGILIVVIAVTWMIPSHQIKTNNAYIQGEITPVSVEVTGRVTQVLITDNQFVQQGDVLVILDDSDYLSHVQQAQAALEINKAAMVSLQARDELQQLKIKEAAAYVSKADADNELQQNEMERYNSLVKSGAVSLSQHETQRSKAKVGRANLSATELQLTNARQQLKTLEAERLQLVAQRQQAIATLALSQSALKHTRVLAPVSGIVANRAVQQGKYVNAGSSILVIVPMDNLWLVANYKETQLTGVQQGQTVTVMLDMFPDSPITGTVLSLSPSTGAKFSLLPPDNATGNFVKTAQRLPVKIGLQIPEELQGRIVPGLSAQVAINTRPSQQDSPSQFSATARE